MPARDGRFNMWCSDARVPANGIRSVLRAPAGRRTRIGMRTLKKTTICLSLRSTGVREAVLESLAGSRFTARLMRPSQDVRSRFPQQSALPLERGP
jgi:hypothetical protein